jgi:hypothetical protein
VQAQRLRRSRLLNTAATTVSAEEAAYPAVQAVVPDAMIRAPQVLRDPSGPVIRALRQPLQGHALYQPE